MVSVELCFEGLSLGKAGTEILMDRALTGCFSMAFVLFVFILEHQPKGRTKYRPSTTDDGLIRSQCSLIPSPCGIVLC